MQLHS